MTRTSMVIAATLAVATAAPALAQLDSSTRPTARPDPVVYAAMPDAPAFAATAVAAAAGTSGDWAAAWSNYRPNATLRAKLRAHRDARRGDAWLDMPAPPAFGSAPVVVDAPIQVAVYADFPVAPGFTGTWFDPRYADMPGAPGFQALAQVAAIRERLITVHGDMPVGPAPAPKRAADADTLTPVADAG